MIKDSAPVFLLKYLLAKWQHNAVAILKLFWHNYYSPTSDSYFTIATRTVGLWKLINFGVNSATDSI